MAIAGILASRSIGASPHGAMYYNGYIYVGRRDETDNNAILYKINVENYYDMQSLIAVFGLNAGITDMVRVGEYLYLSTHSIYVSVISLATFEVDHLITLSTDKGSGICSDGTNLYVSHEVTPGTGKISRINIATEAVDEFDIGSQNCHSICEDGLYLYFNDVAAGRLYRVLKSTMAVVDYATTGVCTDDITQDATYVYLGKESVSGGIVRVTKSTMAVSTASPAGIGLSYGVFNIGGRILYLDYENDYIWEFNASLTLINTWVFTLPIGLVGINELMVDDDGYFHSSTFTVPGVVKYTLGNITYDETGALVDIKVKCSTIGAKPEGVLALSINNSFVDAQSVKVTLRTINQGHSMFGAMLDNSSNMYDNLFGPRDAVEIFYKDVSIFKGTLDSGRHVLEQTERWNLLDRYRIAGRDMSYLLGNYKYTRTFPIDWTVAYMIAEACYYSGCPITVLAGSSPTLKGSTVKDTYLLDMITEMFEKGNIEGYVAGNKILMWYNISSPPSTGITLDRSNILSAVPIEFDGSDIKNHIEVLGDLKLEEPENADSWTDAASLEPPPLGSPGPLWTKLKGTSLVVSPYPGIIGKCLKCYTILESGSYHAHVRFTFPSTIRANYKGQYKSMEFWTYAPVDVWPDNDFLRVHLCSSGGYFYTDVSFPTIVWPFFSDNWLHVKLDLGLEQTNSLGFPDGMWHPVGDPDWLNLTHAEFYGIWSNNAEDDNFIIDGLKFTPKRTHYDSYNTTSIARYGIRKKSVTGDYATNAECKQAADDLNAKLSSPVELLQVVVPLDTLIVGGVWKGIVAHTAEIDLAPAASGTYRIQDIVVDIDPYNDIRNGHDAIATINMVKTENAFEPNAYVSTVRPRTASLLKRYVEKDS